MSETLAQRFNRLEQERIKRELADAPMPVENPLTYRAPKPVYWLVMLKDEDTGRIYASRFSEKCHTPQDAYDYCFGRGGKPTKNMLFFNCSSSIATARKLIRKIGLAYKS